MSYPNNSTIPLLILTLQTRPFLLKITIFSFPSLIEFMNPYLKNSPPKLYTSRHYQRPIIKRPGIGKKEYHQRFSSISLKETEDQKYFSLRNAKVFVL